MRGQKIDTWHESFIFRSLRHPQTGVEEDGLCKPACTPRRVLATAGPKGLVKIQDVRA